MGPMDYSMKVANPMATAVQGMQLGGSLASAQQAAQDKQAQAEAQQRMNEEIAQVIGKGSPSASDFAALTVKYPHFNKQFEQAWGMLNEEQKSNRVSQASEVYAALASGNNDVAQQLLATQADAAENAGDQSSAKAARVMQEIIKLNPEQAQTSFGLRLASMMGADKFTETFTKMEADRRARNLEESDLTTAQSKAYKAAVEADFAESNAATDLQKKGWDIFKIQEDAAISRQNSRIAALNNDLKKEANALKREQMQTRLEEMKRKRDMEVNERAAEVESARLSADNMLNTIDRVLSLPAGTLEDATGAWDGSWIGGVIDTFDQDVQDFKSLMENVDAQAFIAQVQSTPLKGALSDTEGAKLTRALQSFNTKQSTPQFVKNLKEAQRLIMKARSGIATRYGVPESVPDTPDAQVSQEELDDILARYPEGG